MNASRGSVSTSPSSETATRLPRALFRPIAEIGQFKDELGPTARLVRLAVDRCTRYSAEMERLGDAVKVFGRTVEEMESLAIYAVTRAVAEHHRQGRTTYFWERGVLYEQRPSGLTTVFCEQGGDAGVPSGG